MSFSITSSEKTVFFISFGFIAIFAVSMAGRPLHDHSATTEVLHDSYIAIQMQGLSLFTLLSRNKAPILTVTITIII